MTYPRLGHALIVNNVASTQPGSTADERVLERTFTEMGFSVKTERDLSQQVGLGRVPGGVHREGGFWALMGRVLERTFTEMGFKVKTEDLGQQVGPEEGLGEGPQGGSWGGSRERVLQQTFTKMGFSVRTERGLMQPAGGEGQPLREASGRGRGPGVAKGCREGEAVGRQSHQAREEPVFTGGARGRERVRDRTYRRHRK